MLQTVVDCRQRLQDRRARTAVLLLFLLSLCSAQPVAQTVCDDGSASRAATTLKCASLDQLQTLLDYEKQPDEDEDAVRDLLITANQIADCLKDEQRFPVTYSRQQDFLCLQQKMLAFYSRVGDGMLRFEDRLARASIAKRHCIFPEDYPAPDGSGETQECEGLIGTALIDYHTVFAAAYQLKKEPGRYSSAYLAEKLGMDPFDPAPEYKMLQEFIDMSVRSAAGHQELGRQVGSALGPTLCNALELYPGHEDEVKQAYNILIRFDGGNMAGTAHLYLFEKRLGEIFRLEPPDWSNTIPACQPSRQELELPPIVAQSGQLIGTSAELGSRLQELSEMLETGAERLSDRSQAWKPFYRYGVFLYELASALRVPSARSSQARDSRHLLVETSCDALMNGIRLSHPPTSDNDLGKIRSALTSQIREYGTHLFRALRFEDQVEFVSRYFKPKPGTDTGAEEAQGKDALTAEDLLTEAQQQQLHTLLAQAYFMQAELTRDERKKRDLNAQALKHVRKSDITIQELKELRDEMRRFGVRIRR